MLFDIFIKPERRAQLQQLNQNMLEETDRWTRDGTEPEAAVQDRRFTMDLQEARLKSKSLTLETVSKTEGNPDMFQYSNVKTYEVYHITQSGRQRVTIRRGTKRLYTKHFKVEFLTDAIGVRDGDYTAIGKEGYSCPNCGAVTTVEALQTGGCPYCGSRFMIQDLFPKVLRLMTRRLNKLMPYSYLLIYLLGIPGGLFGYWLETRKPGYGALGGTFSFYYFLGIAVFVMNGLLAALGIFIAVMILYGIFIGIRGIIRSFRMRGRPGVYRRVRAMQRQAGYDFKHFLVLGQDLAERVVFSDQPEELSQYAGPPTDPAFRDIIRMVPLVEGKVRDLRFRERMMEADLVWLMENFYLTDGQLHRHREYLYMTMEHARDTAFSPEFSIRVVTCASCGGSFDALKRKHCPWCGSPYDLGNAWVVTRLSKTPDGE